MATTMKMIHKTKGKTQHSLYCCIKLQELIYSKLNYAEDTQSNIYETNLVIKLKEV